jgi:hypothetical protein
MPEILLPQKKMKRWLLVHWTGLLSSLKEEAAGAGYLRNFEDMSRHFAKEGIVNLC